MSNRNDNRIENRGPSLSVYIGESLAIKATEGRRPGIYYRLLLTDRERILFGVAPNVEASPRLLLTVMLTIALEKGFAKDKDGNTILAKRNATDVSFTFVGKDGNAVTRKIPRADLEEALKRVKAVEDADKAEAELSQPPKLGAMAAAVAKSGIKAADLPRNRPTKVVAKVGKTSRPSERIAFAKFAEQNGVDVDTVLKAFAAMGKKVRPEFPDSFPAFMEAQIVASLKSLFPASIAVEAADPNEDVCTISELLAAVQENRPDVTETSMLGAAAAAGVEAPTLDTVIAMALVANIEVILKNGV